MGIIGTGISRTKISMSEIGPAGANRSPGLRWCAVDMTSVGQTDERATWAEHVGVNVIVPRSVRKQDISDDRGGEN